MRRTKRPQLWWLLVALTFSQGAMYLTYFVLYTVEAETYLHVIDLIMHGRFVLPQALIALAFLVGTWLVLGMASVVVGVGLRRGRPWAWSAALTLEGAILILGLETYFNRQANLPFYVSLAVAIPIAFLLNQREIQMFYQARRPGPAETLIEKPTETLIEKPVQNSE
jgi:hypothetical protein